MHVHVAKGRPAAGTTKIWLTRNGGCMLASNGSKLNKKDLANVMDFILANYDEICERWKAYFHGDISFYRQAAGHLRPPLLVLFALCSTSLPPVRGRSCGDVYKRQVHTSLRLKPQMSDAMATPMPLLAETRMLGNVVGSRRGSFMAPS